MHPDRGLPWGTTKIPSGNKQHENHTRWWWQSPIARIHVIPVFSHMHSFNDFFFFTKQLAHKYLEDDQAFSRWSSAARWAPSWTLQKGSKGELPSLAAACADLYWWDKAAGRERSREGIKRDETGSTACAQTGKTLIRGNQGEKCGQPLALSKVIKLRAEALITSNASKLLFCRCWSALTVNKSFIATGLLPWNTPFLSQQRVHNEFPPTRAQWSTDCMWI